MKVVWTKVLALSLMTILSLAFGLLPLWVRKLLERLPGSIEASKMYLSASLCFGAGILFGTTFLHLLPETLEQVSTAQDDGFIVDTNFPIGALIFCSGFFFMYTLEELVHMWVHRHQVDTENHHHVHHSHNPHHSNIERSGTHTQRFSLHMANGLSSVNELELAHSAKHELEQPSAPLCRNQRRRCESLPSVAVLVGCDNPVICTDTLNNCTHSTVPASLSNETLHHHSQSNLAAKNTDSGPNSVTTLRSVLVIVALSIHGCLEGLSLGLEEVNSDVWMMFLALSAHKIAIAFSIGMELLEKEVRKKIYVLYMIIFSLASPLGGLIGALTLEFSDNTSAAGVITVTILQGISGGTIMFVVFCEVLERERCKTSGRMSRLCALTLGFALTACLMLLEGHEEHGGGDSATQPTVSVQ